VPVRASQCVFVGHSVCMGVCACFAHVWFSVRVNECVSACVRACVSQCVCVCHSAYVCCVCVCACHCL
jgi:hypothetical protein